MQAFPLERIGSGDTGYTGSGLDGHLVGLPVRCVLAFTAAQRPRLFFRLANLYSRLLLGKAPRLMLPTWRQRESGVLGQPTSLVPGSSERPAWSERYSISVICLRFQLSKQTSSGPLPHSASQNYDPGGFSPYPWLPNKSAPELCFCLTLSILELEFTYTSQSYHNNKALCLFSSVVYSFSWLRGWVVVGFIPQPSFILRSWH